MRKELFITFIILFLLSACGVGENPASIDNLKNDYEEILNEMIDDSNDITTSKITTSPMTAITSPPIIITKPEQEVTELKQEEIIESEILEPLIVMGDGHDLFTGNYHINVISLCGKFKQIEYEYENGEERYNIDMNRFANVIYKQMNDDNPITAQFDKIPDNIIELVTIIETLELDKSGGFGAENWQYHVIIGSDEERQAVFIGYRWGPGGSAIGGANELTRAINEYLENTERRVP